MPAHRKAGRFERQLAVCAVCLVISSVSMADVVLDGTLGPAGALLERALPRRPRCAA